MKIATIINPSDYPQQLKLGQIVNVIQEFEDKIVVSPRDNDLEFCRCWEYYSVSPSDIEIL